MKEANGAWPPRLGRMSTMVALQRVWHLDSVPVLGSEAGTVAVTDTATKVLDVCEP